MGGYSVYLLINTFSYCAVDGFAIVSGYMENNRLRKWIRLFESRRSGFLIMIWGICIVVTWGTSICGIDYLTNYVFPIIMFNGLIMVILFSSHWISNLFRIIIMHLSL